MCGKIRLYYIESGDFMKNKKLLKLTYSAVCLALVLVLPFLTGQIKEIGNKLCPMHLPVMLCGMLCGAPWGMVVGFVGPILRSMIFGMPVMFPGAVAMAFELATYGAVSGMMYKFFPKKFIFTVVSLVFAMLAGRIVWGVVQFAIAGMRSMTFTFRMFVAKEFIDTFPGMLVQIALIPPIMLALRNAKLTLNED